MPSTGDRCNDLYELSKALNSVKWRNDKSKEDYEFEKSKEECTFVPNLNKVLGDEKRLESNYPSMRSTSCLKLKKHSLQPSKSVSNIKAASSTVNRL
jgi:hypothetical protein